MKKNHKKIFLIVLGTVLLLQAGLCFALEVEYPKIGQRVVTPESTAPEYLEYVFYAGLWLGGAAFLISLAYAGVLYFLSPAIPSMRAQAKDRVSGAISGLLILALCYLIITAINPELAIFRLEPLPKVEIAAPEKKKPAGAYLYRTSGCQDSNALPAIYSSASMPNVAGGKALVKSAGIVQDGDNGLYYVATMYDGPNYWGSCWDISPNGSCQEVSPGFKVISTSVYQYSFAPHGNGVTFYRKSFFNGNGGYLKISNGQINGIYAEKLSNLTFQNVPENEQICIKWDKDNTCTKKESPDLSGSNISSIKIDGDYVVYLVYFGGNDSEYGPWTFCQEYPTSDDAYLKGPLQIKWDKINNAGYLPNYMFIVPVQR